MLKKIAFIAYYKKKTIFSFNAVVGAIESDGATRNIDVFFIRERKELLKNLESILKRFDKVIVAFSIFTAQYWDTSQLIKKIRKKYRNRMILIAGGPHPSGKPRQTLRIGIDVVFIGESERSIVNFIKALQHGDNYNNVKGIAFFDKDGNYIRNKKEDFIDLDNYPPFPLRNTQFGAIEIARGCPYMCHFCQTPFLLGQKPRYRSIETICKYIKILKKENLTDIRFIAPNAFSYGSSDGKSINLQKVEKLLSEVKAIIGKNGRIFYGSFPSEVRPEHVTPQTLGIIQKYANNDNIIIGAQSGSQRILDYCHRGHTVEQVYDAVDLTIKQGLQVNVDFIFGLPTETKTDRNETLRVMKALIKKGARIHAHTFMPHPNTPFSKLPFSKIGKKTKTFLKEYNFRGHVYGNWRRQEKIRKKVSKLLKKNI